MSKKSYLYYLLIYNGETYECLYEVGNATKLKFYIMLVMVVITSHPVFYPEKSSMGTGVLSTYKPEQSSGKIL